MTGFSDLLAFCHAAAANIARSPASLPLSLFLVGLAGSLSHCVGMCGPFVLGQVVADVEGRPAARYGEWQRLRGASLVPYHVGRITTYTLLGVAAGAVTSAFARTSSFGWLTSALLLVASCAMIAQAIGLAANITMPWSSSLSQMAGPLLRSRAPLARYGLGIALGFLPCGLLYGALAAAGGTASASLGGAAMAAFCLGTVPALMAVGWAGSMARRRIGDIGHWVAAPLLLANAALMAALAIRGL